jgi:hypothetical protein
MELDFLKGLGSPEILGSGPGDQVVIPVSISDTLEFVQLRMCMSLKIKDFISA